MLGLYSGKNAAREGFEYTEEVRRSLSFLIKDAECHPEENSSGMPLGMESSSRFFTLPEDLWFITYERALNVNETCDSKYSKEVYPVRQDEYSRIRKNPFRGANDRRALRLDLADRVIEIISNTPVTSYYVRYLRKLNPIIVADLDDNEICGEYSPLDPVCELPEFLHQRILELAVAMALQAKGLTNRNENR